MKRRHLALALFVASSLVACASLLARRQLGFLGGLADEWFLAGMNLRAFGSFGIVPGQPDAVLAPGYPAFVAAVLLAFAGDPGPSAGAWSLADPFVVRGLSAVLLMQAFALAASAALLFLFLSTRIRRELAFLAGLVLGTSPYSVALAGLLHYDVVHMLLLVAGGWLLQRAADQPARPLRLLAAGAAWGLAALVRPIALILPPFVLVGLWWSWRRALVPALRGAALFVLAMALVVAPWSVRNRFAVGRLVPVNSEGWMALWGSTVRALPRDAQHSQWEGLYRSEFLPVFSRVTGQAEYSRPTFIRYHGALESAFRAQALANIAAQPAIYARNVARAFLTVCLDLNSVVLRIFEAIQQPGVRMVQDWLRPGRSLDELPARGLGAFTIFFHAATLLAILGVPLALFGRARLVMPVMVLASIVAAHSLVYMDFMYYYVKMPFLILLAFVALDAAAELEFALPGGRARIRPARWLAVALTLLSLATTALVLLP
jgi:hypothetical protein